MLALPLCHLVLGDFSSFSAPQCERGTEWTSESRREAGGKEKDEARQRWKSRIKIFTLPHGYPVTSTLFSFALQHISICHLFLFFKCTLYWFDLMFGLISFSPLFPALVSRSDKRLIDCIPCSEPDIPIKGFKAEFLVCQSLHCIFCSCLCWSQFHWFFTHLFLKQTVGHSTGKHAV